MSEFLEAKMKIIAVALLLCSITSANAGDGCPKGTQFYCWTDPVTLVMHCSCS